MAVTTRVLRTADHDWALALNNAAVPAVNELDSPALSELVAICAHARVAEVDGEPLGLLIAFAPGASYGSENYAWFSAEYDDFMYVDRVIVDPSARGKGVGRALYQDLVGLTRGRFSRITCEVNERPPNPGSIRFHEAFGFEVVGRQETGGGEKAVVLMAVGV